MQERETGKTCCHPYTPRCSFSMSLYSGRPGVASGDHGMRVLIPQPPKRARSLLVEWLLLPPTFHRKEQSPPSFTRRSRRANTIYVQAEPRGGTAIHPPIPPSIRPLINQQLHQLPSTKQEKPRTFYKRNQRQNAPSKGSFKIKERKIIPPTTSRPLKALDVQSRYVPRSAFSYPCVLSTVSTFSKDLI